MTEKIFQKMEFYLNHNIIKILIFFYLRNWHDLTSCICESISTIMKDILNKTGYLFTETPTSPSDVKLALLTINNPDGSPRWIWNATSKKPLFLKFYAIATGKARAFSVMIKIIFALRMQHLFFKKKNYYFSVIEKPIFNISTDWALFTGTVGPNNKAVLFANSCFYKIALTPHAKHLINFESGILKTISGRSNSFKTPNVLEINHSVIQLEDVSSNGQRAGEITQRHLDALIEMQKLYEREITLEKWELFENLKNDLNTLEDSRIPFNLKRKIRLLIDTMDQNTKIKLSFAHGDFTPWNCYVFNDHIAVYDWELAAFDKPKGFDLFHYVFQKGILTDHKPFKSIYKDVKQYAMPYFEGNQEELHNCLQWYLLVNTMYYLRLYAQQKEWHVQINWLLQTWSEAFNIFLKNDKTPRQLVIMDLFDALQNHKYAALKFPNSHPENLSLNSDIDLVIRKKDSAAIFQMLKNHSHVANIYRQQKSHMQAIQCILNDGSILSVDLIWQLKRRNIIFQDVDKVLENSYINNFRVSNISVKDLMHYIVSFYTLNNSAIPAKYKVYQEAIIANPTKIDHMVKAYFENPQKVNKSLLHSIKQQKENRGFSYFRNTIQYLYDTLNCFYQGRKGFVITFSGVDGAGKSTVIEKVANMIEKQIRKPVVILRHRPSILPILSALAQGKEKAAKNVADRLPRTGNNTSVIASIFRFLYYYSDYFFGQFIVAVRYTMRGYVVIYDRYYFDFMTDAKRSNIVLSEKLSGLGYLFLLKPRFNFLLFADPEEILSRKQELDAATIKMLTARYQKLFLKLNKNNRKSLYESIYNNDLNNTLGSIFRTIKTAAI